MDYFPPTFKVVAGVGSFLQVDSKKSRRLILSGPLPGPAEEVTASPVAWVYGGPDFAGRRFGIETCVRRLSSRFCGRASSVDRIFEEKLASIINSVGADQAFLPPMPDRVYRDAASLGHFRDGEHTAFPEPVESASLVALRLPNQVDVSR
jgi:hypothetical protein